MRTKTKSITLTEDEFEARFKPETDADGGTYVMREFPKDRLAILDADATRRLWTMVETDSGIYLVQGHHFVNLLYFVICNVPYKEGEKFDIEMDDMSDMDD